MTSTSFEMVYTVSAASPTSPIDEKRNRGWNAYPTFVTSRFGVFGIENEGGRNDLSARCGCCGRTVKCVKLESRAIGRP